MRTISLALLISALPLTPLGFVDAQKPKQPNKGAVWSAGNEYDGVSISADLPPSQQFRNVGGSDGAGLCVNSSIEMAALSQGIEELRGYRNWSRAFPGGSWPQKVDKQLAEWFKLKGLPKIPYLVYEGKNPETILDLASLTGRMPACTFGAGHMTNCVLFGPRYGVILDNNAPQTDAKKDTLYWMSRAECVKRVIHHGKGWVHIWLASPAPPRALEIIPPRIPKAVP